MSVKLLLLVSLLAGFVATASPVTYDVTLDTSSISGTTGSLDFNFNPGLLVTQAADLQILNFSSDGTLEACASNVQGFCNTGDVSGTLPATLTFDNGTAFNDYFDGFTFGSTLSFQVSLYGPALSSPDGTSTSGSTFAFSMFSDSAGIMPVLTSDTSEGFAFTVDTNLDGTTAVSNFSAQTSVVPETSAVPEPRDFVIPATALLMLVLFTSRRRLPA